LTDYTDKDLPRQSFTGIDLSVKIRANPWPACFREIRVPEEFCLMLSIRPANSGDVSVLKTMIHEFAAFERLPVVVTEASLLRDGFSERPRFRVLMAEWDGQPAGYAFFFDYYSTFEGRAGIFLEDIYVRERYRGNNIGKALLARVASIARHEDCFGVRWQVLDWNTPAIDFYRKLGADFLDEWKTVSLQGNALEHLAANASRSEK
jgi:GNAT superfamily N-acetyltransferase